MAESPHEFGSTQFDLPDALAGKVRALTATIHPDHLAEDDREASPHVTVQYGLNHTAPADVRTIGDRVASHPPVVVTLGKTSVFPASETGSSYDVVKVGVDGAGLHTLRAAIRSVAPVTDTHPTYQPHVTLAYVKPGMGARYAADESLVGETATFNHLTLSDRDGLVTRLPLTGTPGGTMVDSRTAAESGHGGFLVTEADGTTHLPTRKDGKADHGLMGAAWAALHSGYRGKTYDGPGKDAAIAKLTALYKSEGMETPGSPQGMDEPSGGDVHVNAPLGAQKKPRYLTRLRELVARTMGSKGHLTAEDWAAHQRSALGHAGGMARSTQAAETPASPPADFEPCAACMGGDEADCACRGCTAGQPCWCDQAMGADEGEAEGGMQAREPLFSAINLSEAPEWIPYLPRPGTFQHAAYGEMVFTRESNADYVAKFNAGVYQTDSQGKPSIPIDAEHESKVSGAMGWISALRMNADGSADARVAWTDRGRTMLAQNRFKFFSPEIYPLWRDPLTSKAIKNVAIGGALTTRPYFKTNAQGSALRPLAASEQGMLYIYIPTDAMPPVPARAGGPPSTALSGPEETMGTQAETTTAVQLSEADIKRLTEVEAKYAESQKLIEAAQADAVKATERVARLEKDARTRRFTEQAGAWIGPVADHVSFMEGLSEEQLSFYATQQSGIAVMLKDSHLFKEIGRSGADVDGSAEGKLRGIAAKLREATPKLTEAAAFSEALDANPALYERYLAEQEA